LLVGRICEVAPEESIFFVDDNSPDGTADEIRRLQRQDPHHQLMQRPSKLGYGSGCPQAIQKILAETSTTT